MYSQVWKIENWRPLTLLNGSYKILSSMIAERIKHVLEVIINGDQTGFISYRFIGENTRLLFDTITYTEAEQIPRLLILVDYAKKLFSQHPLTILQAVRYSH